MINNTAQIKPRTISLFSGCGGLDLGFHQAGFDIVFSNDIEKTVEATYRHNLGEILIKDIKEVDVDSEIPNDIDVILAGIPCQPFSSAGNRKSMDDHRGGLFESVMNIVDKKSRRLCFLKTLEALFIKR